MTKPKDVRIALDVTPTILIRNSSASSQYIATLDGLRGIAAVAVLLFHIDEKIIGHLIVRSYQLDTLARALRVGVLKWLELLSLDSPNSFQTQRPAVRFQHSRSTDRTSGRSRCSSSCTDDYLVQQLAPLVRTAGRD